MSRMHLACFHQTRTWIWSPRRDNRLPKSEETVQTGPMVEIKGLICAGRGVAARGVGINSDRIATVLGEPPYPGTLNVVFDMPMTMKGGSRLDKKAKHFGIQGEINGHPCLIGRFKGGPLHVVEIIASTFLRDTLELQDRQYVKLSVPKGSFVQTPKWRSWLWSLFYQGRPEGYYDDKVLKKILRWKLFHKLVCQKRFN